MGSSAMGASVLWRERALLMTVICAGSALVAAADLGCDA